MKYNDVIIGFGKGGKTIAGALGNAGSQIRCMEEPASMWAAFLRNHWYIVPGTQPLDVQMKKLLTTLQQPERHSLWKS